MCGAFQFFTTTASTLDSGPAETTEPSETLDQYDNTGQRDDETVDEDDSDIVDAEEEDDTDSEIEISDVQIEVGNLSVSIESLCLQFLLFDTDRDLFISREEVEMRRNVTLEGNDDRDTGINQTDKKGDEDTADKGITSGQSENEKKEDQQVSEDGNNDDQTNQDESRGGTAGQNAIKGSQADEDEKEEDQASEEQNRDEQAEKTSGDVDDGTAEEEANGEHEEMSGTQSLNINDTDSEMADKVMERMNSSTILALDIDNDSLVSLAEFLRQKSDFYDIV